MKFNVCFFIITARSSSSSFLFHALAHRVRLDRPPVDLRCGHREGSAQRLEGVAAHRRVALLELLLKLLFAVLDGLDDVSRVLKRSQREKVKQACNGDNFYTKRTNKKTIYERE